MEQLMPGVYSMKEIPIYQNHELLGMLVGALVAIIVLFLLSFKFSISTFSKGAVCIIALGMMLGVIIGNCFHEDLIETRYEIIFDGTVNFDEFNDKYEILQQRESSWIVRRRS